MSIINQMLRDLDARGAVATGPLVTPVAGPTTQRDTTRRTVIGLGMLAMAAAALYWGWPQPAREQAPAVDTAALQEQAAEPPAATEPELHPRPEPAPSAVPPVSLPAAPERALAQPERKPEPEHPPAPPAVQVAAATVAPAEVVKTSAASSPQAEAHRLYDEAQALRRAGKSDAALALLQQGYALRAADVLAIAAGRLLADRGQSELALDWLARGGQALRPADHALMGALLSQTGRHEEASRAYQRALAADPAQGGWLLGLGLALEAQGRQDEARVAYRKALERGEFKPEVTRFLRERSGPAEP